jgi:Cof subfamily protein (haloacid dehalogenase superfamily)
MDMIFFDLDGTLLNAQSEISPFTRETLGLLKKNNIAYTVATGRSMLSAKNIIAGHDFHLPHIYNNGVTVWDPSNDALSFENLLTTDEIKVITLAAMTRGITPFVNTVEKHQHFIFHSEPKHQVEKDLIAKHFNRTDASLLAIETLPAHSSVTNISMIGQSEDITEIWNELNRHEHLIAYSGPAHEGGNFRWMDVHHCLANKGSAVEALTKQFEASNVICFGDSDNDMSMFELANEAYAPANAKAPIKEKASAIIGHHDEDGIAKFLRERFSL